LRAWPLLGILFIQGFLCLAHWLLYFTWMHAGWPMSPGSAFALRAALTVLCFSFVPATLLGFRFHGGPVALIYRLASVWMGLLNFLFWSACLFWLLDLVLRLAPGETHLRTRPLIAAALVAVSVLATLYGLLNAAYIRTRNVTVGLSNLPATWRGRRAVVVSDLHLGNINGLRFARRVASRIRALAPEIVFLPGDLFDGTRVDPETIAAPLLELAPQLGVYFVTGNHEVFGGSGRFTEPLSRRGIKVIDNAREDVDGVAILGIAYRDSTRPIRLRELLAAQQLDPARPSILLQHVPNRLPIVEQSGVCLQLSGHTHGGQIFPFTWITRRAFGPFTHGLHRFGNLQVYTSTGVGTWGPPLRVGSASEIVLLTFQ
jgi:uncharacterized protein